MEHKTCDFKLKKQNCDDKCNDESEFDLYFNSRNMYYIKQCHFKCGTYRIKNPGTYTLTENIVFNARHGTKTPRKDLPPNGLWFAAITIECDNVIIDGAGFTLSESPCYSKANNVGVFALICLGNNLFSGGLFGIGGAFFSDTSSYQAANNVKIMNLNTGLSSHFAIKGQQNDDVVIENCNFNGSQRATINLGGPEKLCINNCTLTGASTPIDVQMDQTQLYLVRQKLDSYVDANVVGAGPQLVALNVYAAANTARFTATQAIPSTQYGIFIQSAASSVNRFPLTSTSNNTNMFIENGRIATNIKITNCDLSNYNTESNEKVGIGANTPETPLGELSLIPNLGLFGLFGVWQWKDAFNGTTFSPNEFLKSIAFVMNYELPSLPPSSLSVLPGGNAVITQTIVTSILTNNSTLFFQTVAPIVGLGDDGTFMKGLFGLRVTGATNVKIENVTMDSFASTGSNPIDPTTLPGYGSVITLGTPQPVIRFMGNDAWFTSLEVCNNVSINNAVFSNISSTNGYVFGVDSASEDSTILIQNTILQTMSAPHTSPINAVVDAGDVNGFIIDNATGPITLINDTTQILPGSAGGTITHFPTPSVVPPTLVTLISTVAL